MINTGQRNYAPIFHPTFLSAIPAEKLDALFDDLHKQHGDCTAVEVGEPVGLNAAKVNFVFADVVIPGRLSVNPGQTHLINGLFFGVATERAKSLEAIVKDLEALPGACGFLVQRWDDRQPATLASLHPDQPLAIGSTFKLYILAELMRRIDAGERGWADVVKLDAKAISLPSGVMRDWPVGSPMTLHTLAAMMISQSDNTATDQLLRGLGREPVEGILAAAGNEHGALSTPFLSTREMFTLHSRLGLSKEYIAADVAGRRRLLETSVADAGVDPSGLTDQPARFEKIEWFASSADLCRTLDYLRRKTEAGPAAEARKILSINPGLPIDKTRFPVICYKGGSEPGVLSLSYLLRSAKGEWFTLSVTWNNPKAALDEEALFKRVRQAIQLLG